MEPTELKSMVDLVAELVACRLADRAAAADQGTTRIDKLLADMKAISSTYGVLPEVLRDVRQSLDDHEFARLQQEIGELRRLEGPGPPDDLASELERLAGKIATFRNPSTFEYKTPRHVQINVVLLVSIFLEILDILKKLGRRAIAPGQQGPDDAVRFAGIAVVRDTETLIVADLASPVAARLDDAERRVVSAILLDIQQSGGWACEVKYIRVKDSNGDTKTLATCMNVSCTDSEGCHLLRRRSDGTGGVEDLGPSPPARPVVMPGFSYWCRCGAFPVDSSRQKVPKPARR
jgi:hypothetical protein